jgi:hypothetical protein
MAQATTVFQRMWVKIKAPRLASVFSVAPGKQWDQSFNFSHDRIMSHDVHYYYYSVVIHYSELFTVFK